MSWIGEVFSSLWKPKRLGSSWFYAFSSNADVWGFGSERYLESFNSLPELSAVIGLKARAFANGQIKALDKNGKELPNGVPECLQFPNWFQGQKEFLRQTKLFREIYGDEYLYMLFGVGMGPERTKALYTIPPNLVECEYKSKQPFFVFTERPPEIEYCLKETEDPIPIEQLIHLNDNRVTVKSAHDKKILSGESKMRSLAPSINNLRMAYEARGVIMRNRGAFGILSNNSSDAVGSTLPLDPKEKERLDQEFSNYGTLKGQSHTIITSQNLRWQKMGVNPSELGLYEETLEDFFKICDTYGTPIDLFASNKGSTFENQRQAEKGLYLRTIIPEANEWIGAVSKSGIVPEGVTLVMDFSHLHIFAEDLKQRGDSLAAITNALSKMLVDQAITLDEYKEELRKYGIGKA